MSKEKYKEYYKDYYQKNKEKLGQKTKKWREGRQDLYWLASVRYRCKKNNIPFDLDPSDIIIPERCPVLGIEFKRGKGHPEDTSPSIDRIDPTKGYTKGNVQIMSNLANKMKANATPEQLLAFADWVYKNYG